MDKLLRLIGFTALVAPFSGSFAAPPTSPAREDKPAYAASVPLPTMAGVKYGAHPRHVLDFWKAASETPTPVVLVIHGGGWRAGSKERLDRFVDPAALLDAGVSVVAINYRLIQRDGAKDEVPPVKGPLMDAARALQFVRSKAEAWDLDKERIAAAGGSAGACSSLWLAFSDDLADPDHEDPVARESTRLWCAAVKGAQTTLDPRQMKAWTPNSKYGAHAFGLRHFAEFLDQRDEIQPWIDAYSPYALVSADDPPVYLRYATPPALGKRQADPTHTANFGVKMKERCESQGVACELVYPGAPGVVHDSTTAFLISTLKGNEDQARSGFVPLFNGTDLSGWDGDPELWNVEDGVVVGTCDGPAHLRANSFLIWRGGTVKDFELRVTMRVVGDNNSGIQYRSRELGGGEPWAISGYQCDVHPALEHTGMTYEEKGRGIFGLNGKKVLVDPQGRRWLLAEYDPVKVDTARWNEYTVIARGNHLIHRVNGSVSSEMIDCEEKGRALEGLVAFQLHRGKAHRVEIRNVEMRVLPGGEVIPFSRDRVAEAEPIEKPRTNHPQGIAPVPR